MTLGTAPLTVRVGDRHVTAEVSGLSFREEAVGGVRWVTLRLFRPLHLVDGDAAMLTPVTVWDARTAEQVAQGRISDTGRSAGLDGQVWAVTCFGPAQHASDQRRPLVYVDSNLDSFTRNGANSSKGAKTGTDERSNDEPTLLISADEGKAISSWAGEYISRAMQRAGMKLARVRCSIDAGITSANYDLQVRARENDGTGSLVASATADTSASSLSGVVVTDFPNGRNQMALRAVWTGSTRTATEDDWFEYWNIAQRALLLDQDGSEITTGYSANTVLAHEVVKDLLGRMLPQFDGAGAEVATSGTYAIDQLNYLDGATATDVLTDLMALEPAYYWTTGPDVTGLGYQFAWRQWPTVVRYEATLDDGGEFPASAQTVYNRVTVRWTNPRGRTRTTTRTSAAAGVTGPTLDAMAALGIVRSDIIDAADETGSANAATRLADNWLAEHANPANAGTLTIARPIRDLVTGGMVDPHEVRAGELVRVRGIEGYPDALNASASDGQTVFRIWAKEYTSETHSARLELDTYPRTTAAALALIAKKRRRKR